MGAPGLAFETWDPRNQCSVDTHDVTTGQRIPSTNEAKQAPKYDQQAGDTLQQAQPASGDPAGLFYLA
jgi:hypothetical protein